MNFPLLPSLIEAIGWTLLHSLWQWTLLALLGLGLSRMMSQASARARYQVLLGILLIGCLSSGLTGWLGFQAESPTPVGSEMTAYPGEAVFLAAESASMELFSWENIRQQLSPSLPYLTGLWLLGVLLMSLRMGSGFWYLQSLKTRQVSPVPAFWAKTSAKLSQRLGIARSVQVLESARITGPMTLGHLKPVILLPLGMLTGMNPDQIEAILAHELAHIHRADYFVNLIQSLIEILFFFHPAVWWISREIRQEREACCDDLAVAICGDAFVYASALTRVQALRSTFQPHLSMNATGLNSHFSRRIQRLMGVHRPHSFSGKSISLSLIALLLSMGLGIQVLAQSKAVPLAGEVVYEWAFTSDMGPKEVKQVMASIRQVNPNFFLRELNFDAQNKLNHLIICEERTPGMVTCLEVKELEQLHFAWRPEEDQPAKFSLHGGEMIIHPAEDHSEEIESKNLLKGQAGFVELKKGGAVIVRPSEVAGEEAEPLYIIDGVPQSAEAFGKIKANPDRIKSINVLKGEAATEAYQEAGKNGVVEIRLKPISVVKVEEQPIKIRAAIGTDLDPLFVIDGVVESAEAFEKVKAQPERIEAVNVLKGEAAKEAYPEAGENGVVEITLKPLVAEQVEVKRFVGVEVKGKTARMVQEEGEEKTIRIRASTTEQVEPLFVVDGVRYDAEAFEQLDLNPNQIARMNALKGESAFQAYQEAGKNGVVEIYLKPVDQPKEEPISVEESVNSPVGPDVTHHVLLDGEVSTWETVGKLAPDDIATMDVWGGEKAINLQKELNLEPTPSITLITTKQGKKPTAEAIRPSQEYNLLASPNGFSDQSIIRFSLPEATQARVEVLNLEGKVVQTLQNGTLKAGSHRLRLDGKALSPGTYLIRLQTPNGQESQRVVYQP